MFVEGFKDWSGSVTNAGSDLLVTLCSPADSGGVNFLLLLKNADNASGNEFLQSDGVLILDN